MDAQTAQGAAEKSANPGRPRDAEVDAAFAAYASRCAELLPEGAASSDPYVAAARHAALEEALAGSAHPGLRSALISRCRRAAVPLPPGAAQDSETAAIEAVLIAVWRFESDGEGGMRVVTLGHRFRPLLPEHPSLASLLVWRERAAVRRINALAPRERKAAVARLAARCTRPA